MIPYVLHGRADGQNEDRLGDSQGAERRGQKLSGEDRSIATGFAVEGIVESWQRQLDLG